MFFFTYPEILPAIVGFQSPAYNPTEGTEPPLRKWELELSFPYRFQTIWKKIRIFLTETSGSENQIELKNCTDSESKEKAIGRLVNSRTKECPPFRLEAPRPGVHIPVLLHLHIHVGGCVWRLTAAPTPSSLLLTRPRIHYVRCRPFHPVTTPKRPFLFKLLLY